MSPLPAWLGRHDLSGCLKEIMIAPIRIGLASKLPGAPQDLAARTTWPCRINESTIGTSLRQKQAISYAPLRRPDRRPALRPGSPAVPARVDRGRPPQRRQGRLFRNRSPIHCLPPVHDSTAGRRAGTVLGQGRSHRAARRKSTGCHAERAPCRRRRPRCRGIPAAASPHERVGLGLDPLDRVSRRRHIVTQAFARPVHALRLASLLHGRVR